MGGGKDKHVHVHEGEEDRRGREGGTNMCIYMRFEGDRGRWEGKREG